MSRRLKARDMGSSLIFAAGTNRVDCGSTDFIGTGDITVSAWVKARSLGGNNNGRIISNGKFDLRLNSPGSIQFSNDATTFASSANNVIPILRGWVFVTATRKNSSGVSNIYVNGVLSGTANQSAGTITAGSTNIFIGNVSSLARGFDGNIDSIRIFNRILSVNEIQNLYFDGTVPADATTSMIAEYMFNGGSATTARDTSGNGRDGAITGAIPSTDVPITTRKPLNYNLVPNGDFEYAPFFVAAGTTSARFIDGTAGGSTTNDVFKWAQIIDAGNVAISFDSNITHSGGKSMKVEALDDTGRGRAVQGNGAGSTGASLTPTLLDRYAIKVLPSTTYEVKYWIKTLNCLTGNHRLNVQQHDSAGTRGTTTAGTTLTGTNDWTLRTITITTDATTRYLVLSAEMTAIGEAKTIWFDDIDIRPSVLTTRTSTSSRLTVRPFGTSLLFGAADTDKVVIPNALDEVHNNLSDLTVALWFKPNLLNKGNNFLFSIPASVGNNRRYMSFGSTGLLSIAVGGSSALVTSTMRFITGKWYQAILQVNWNGKVARLVVNGTNSTAWTAFTQGTGNSDIRIGSQATSGQDFEGVIDQPRIWNRVLTDTELSNLYLKGVVPSNGLVGEWLFNEATGTTTYDSSGRGNNGVITGATYTTDVPIINRTTV